MTKKTVKPASATPTGWLKILAQIDPKAASALKDRRLPSGRLDSADWQAYREVMARQRKADDAAFVEALDRHIEDRVKDVLGTGAFQDDHGKKSAARVFIKENYSPPLPSVKQIARDFEEKTGVEISDSTILRALDRKK
jgi:hypothetical protein